MDAPLPGYFRDRPHIAFTPYLQQLTAGVVDGLEDPLDRARAIYDYLTQHIDYRYQPPYLLLDLLPTTVRILYAAIAALWRSRLSPCAASRACLPVGRAACMLLPIRWGRTIGLSSIRHRPVGLTPTYRSVPRRAGWGGVASPALLWQPRRGVSVANNRFQAEFVPAFDGMREDPYDNQMGEASVDGRGCRKREMLPGVGLSEINQKFRFSWTNQQKAVIN